MKYFWSEILKFIPSLIAPTIVGLILTSVMNIQKVGGFLLAGLSYTIVFALSMWFVGMNQYERELIGRPAKRMLSKIRNQTNSKGTIR
jgi:hypothetical protein